MQLAHHLTDESAHTVSMQQVLNLSIDPTSPRTQTIYTALDETFVTTSIDGDEEVDTSFALLTTLPETLVFALHRQVPAVTSLDSFGGGDGSKRKVFEIQEELWLDRYHVRNRVKVREGRQRTRDLKREIEEVRGRIQQLSVNEVSLCADPSRSSGFAR